jgi:vancomycin permeability regulator SanA
MSQRIAISILLLLVVSSCYFAGPSSRQRLSRAEKHAPIDVAIIPGLPLKNGGWDTLLKTRILWSVYLYKKGIVKNLIYSGNAVYSPYKEGKAMAIYAEALGVPAEHVFIDSLAEHSTENVYYSHKLAESLGFKTMAIATDPFQCAMLYNFSKKNFSTKFYFLPAIDDSILALSSANPTVDVSSAFVKDFIPLPERENYQQRIKASRGGRIKTKVE